MSTKQFSSTKWIRVDLAGLAACLGITAAAYISVYQPIAQASQQGESQRLELTARQEKATKLTAILNALRHELAKIQQNAADNPVALQSTQHSNQRLADLTHLAADHQLELNVVRTESVLTGGRYDIVPIHLNGLGTFQSCTAFLHRLRANFPDTGIVGVELADNPSDPAAKTAFKFDLMWYAATSVASANK